MLYIYIYQVRIYQVYVKYISSCDTHLYLFNIYHYLSVNDTIVKHGTLISYKSRKRQKIFEIIDHVIDIIFICTRIVVQFIQQFGSLLFQYNQIITLKEYFSCQIPKQAVHSILYNIYQVIQYQLQFIQYLIFKINFPQTMQQSIVLYYSRKFWILYITQLIQYLVILEQSLANQRMKGLWAQKYMIVILVFYQFFQFIYFLIYQIESYLRQQQLVRHLLIQFVNIMQELIDINYQTERNILQVFSFWQNIYFL
eukprot:TRINITY_DN5093_c0_g1_i8.p2 TRINITY_DN5093_c0_g1~~TRINITY_DN5093_c0_g1_i8.p2  ORF type:complete len:254 (-),score=-23.61 TRINITY_DN5093_c0_g1_i8:604-1365(-)